MIYVRSWYKMSRALPTTKPICAHPPSCAPFVQTSLAPRGSRSSHAQAKQGYCSLTICDDIAWPVQRKILVYREPCARRRKASSGRIHRVSGTDGAEGSTDDGTDGGTDGEDEDEDMEGYEVRFWQGEEGKRKLEEIEDLAELMNAAKGIEEDFLREQTGEAAGGKGQGDSAEGQVKTAEEMARARAERLREELARKATEQSRRRAEAQRLFDLGQKAYGRGVYDKAVEIFELGLTNVDRGSNLGGEIQVWLAMAYDANGRSADCIALYKRLEGGHPSLAIRRQAADLRYITVAPKLKISKDEMVSVPIFDKDNNSSGRKWSEMVVERRKSKPITEKPGQRDYMDDFSQWKRPRWERSPYFWVAVTAWLTAVGVSLGFQS